LAVAVVAEGRQARILAAVVVVKFSPGRHLGLQINLTALR
jgi:hypothetical protein